MNIENPAAVKSSGPELFAAYEQQRPSDEQHAWATLLAALQPRGESDWLDCVQRLVLRGRSGEAQRLLEAARQRFSDSNDVALALAGLCSSAGREDEAEALLREIFARASDHAAAALSLSDLLRKQARTAAAAEVLRACFVVHRQPLDLAIRAMELLDDCERKADAAAIAEAEIAAGCDDPRMHAYAATYLIQLGEFERARERYLFAYARSPLAPEWDVPFGLASAQRYRDAAHNDFELFRACLARNDLSARARATLLFGMGKAYAEIGDTARAAQHVAQANELARTLAPWSRKQWRRSIDARLQARVPTARADTDSDFNPVFVVGVPRSGTTLAAELLARLPLVCNRGESPWIWTLSQRLAQAARTDTATLEELAREYERQLRRDDAAQARWLVDKQPLNLLHVGFVLAMFPGAKIVYCRRNARDTALSLWTQYFREPGYGFAYDLADIAALQQGCDRTMAHWRARYPASIRELRYEDLATDPTARMADLAEWIGIPSHAVSDAGPSAINTASVWQARQPVYTSSIGRWREWAPFVPDLLRFSVD